MAVGPVGRSHGEAAHDRALRRLPGPDHRQPSEGVLRITMDDPGLNAVSPPVHRDSPTSGSTSTGTPTPGWRCCRRGQGLLGGRLLRAARRPDVDYAARTRVMREARDLVFNVINCSKPIVSAIHGPAVGAGLVAGILADVSVVGRTARIIDGHTRLGVAAGDHAAICWPLLCGMAKAKYYLLTCDTLTGEEAERIGLVSLCVDDGQVQERALAVAAQLAAGPSRRSAGPSRRSTTGTGPGGRCSTPAWPTSSTASADPTPGRAWPATSRSGPRALTGRRRSEPGPGAP